MRPHATKVKISEEVVVELQNVSMWAASSLFQQSHTGEMGLRLRLTRLHRWKGI